MTEALEDSLESVYVLIRDQREARVSEIARRLRVSKPTVVNALASLKRRGYVTQKPYSPVELTTKGRVRATVILNRHHQLRDFLVMLGVPPRQADRDACRLEHVVSAETMDKVRDFIKKGQAVQP